MKRDLTVLLIEDDEDDYEITRETLEEISGVSVNLEWIEAYEQGLERLSSSEIDICFVDYRIGGRTGLEFIRMARDNGVIVPLVLLTGVGQHDIDVAATEAGASDYLDKSELDARTLERTIRYSIAHADAMKALASKTELLSTTLENAGAGIAAIEQNGVCTARNSRFNQMLDAVAGEQGAAQDTNKAAHLIDRIADSLDTTELSEIEIGGLDDGAVYAVSRTRTPRGGAVYVSIDVTQQKAMQNSILRAKSDAEAVSRAKSSFFANISHELRTPLHGIIGFSDLIVREAPTPILTEYADQINQSGKSLLDIINTVISFSRIESGQHTFNDETITDIRHFILDVIKPIQNANPERDLQVSVDVDASIDALRIDQYALRMIVHNLFDNAVRFTADPASINISCKRMSDGAGILMIVDDGIGIAEEKQERVFDAFYQADDTLGRSYEGIGLGLPLARLMTNAHDARITLASVPGEGTQVTVAFPLDRTLPVIADTHGMTEANLQSGRCGN